MTALVSSPNSWPVELQPTLPTSLSADTQWPPSTDSRSLEQFWRRDSREAGFQPGHAWVRWHPAALAYYVEFSGGGQRNDARRLNERTWELGDACEIFIRDLSTDRYIELHITPENNRLQLCFPLGAIDHVRQGKAPLEEFMVENPAWVRTWAEVSATHVRFQAVVPAKILGAGASLGAHSRLTTAVCRYDYPSRSNNPILSSTACFQLPSFHRHEDWTLLELFPAGG